MRPFMLYTFTERRALTDNDYYNWNNTVVKTSTFFYGKLFTHKIILLKAQAH